MSLPLTGPQSVFQRLGSIFGLFNTVNTFAGTTIPPKINNLNSEYATTDQSTIDGIYTTEFQLQNAQTPFQSAMQTLASNTLVAMVNDVQPQTNATSLTVALNFLISSMISASATVNQCLASATVSAAGFNAGNAIVSVGMLGKTGLLQQDAFAEILAGTCTQDAQSGGATPGRETITFLGQYSISSTLSYLYPVGSGSTTAVKCIDGSQNQGRGTQNYLNNSSFESWNANVPNNWIVSTGTPGVTILQSSAVFYDGANSLQIHGNGSELTALYQPFGTSASGTGTTVLPTDQMAFNAFIRTDSAPAAGVITFALADGNNNPILDTQGNPSIVSQSLTSISTTWVPVLAYFRTARILPSAVRLRIALSTALTSGRNLYIDRMALAEPLYAYPGGPALAAFSGNQNLIMGDQYTVNIYNAYNGQFQILFDRFFNMKQLGLLLPSSVSPTIPDSLIS